MEKRRLLAAIFIIGMGIFYVIPNLWFAMIAMRDPLFTRSIKIESATIMLIVVLLCSWITFRLIRAARPKLYILLLVACALIFVPEVVIPFVLVGMGKVSWSTMPWLLLMWWWLHAACYIGAWVVVWPWYRQERLAKNKNQVSGVGLGPPR
jgi:hypothetical protein